MVAIEMANQVNVNYTKDESKSETKAVNFKKRKL